MSAHAHPQSLPFLTKQQQLQQQNHRQQQDQRRQQEHQSQEQAGTESRGDSHLPDGECTYLKPQPGGPPARCDCVAFILDNDKPGSVCGCGHQAWNHVREHAGDAISRDEFAQLQRQVRDLKGFARQMHDELARQKEQRERDNSQLVSEFRKLFETVAKVKVVGEHRTASAHASMEQRVTQVASLATHLEDRIEAVVDKTQNWDQVVEKVNILDEACMRLEERVGLDGAQYQQDTTTALIRQSTGSVRSSAGQALSPVREVSPSDATSTPMPVDRIEQPRPTGDEWRVKVVLLPNRSQRHAFPHSSPGWRRSHSRGLHQLVHLPPRSQTTAADFISAVGAAFKPILQNRPWAPLVCLRSEDKELSQLPPGQERPELWDHTFLEKHCFAEDKLEGEVVYVAPLHDELPWAYIRALPPVQPADETAWEHNTELDGTANIGVFAAPTPPPTTAGMNFSRRTPQPPQRSPFRPHAQNLPPIDAFMKSGGGAESNNLTAPSGTTASTGGSSPFGVRKSSIDTDASSVYESSPPPYTSAARTYNPTGSSGPVADGASVVDSRLNILAMTALGNGRNSAASLATNNSNENNVGQRAASSMSNNTIASNNTASTGFSSTFSHPAGVGGRAGSSISSIDVASAVGAGGPFSDDGGSRRSSGHHQQTAHHTNYPGQYQNTPTTYHAFDPRAALARPSTSGGAGIHPSAMQAQPPPSHHPHHHAGASAAGDAMDVDYDSRSLSLPPLSRSASAATSRSAPTVTAPPANTQYHHHHHQQPQAQHQLTNPQPPSQQGQQGQQGGGQQQLYLSGRSKRKVAPGKYKEPVGLSIGDVRLPRLGFGKHGGSGGGSGGSSGGGGGGPEGAP